MTKKEDEAVRHFIFCVGSPKQEHGERRNGHGPQGTRWCPNYVYRPLSEVVELGRESRLLVTF